MIYVFVVCVLNILILWNDWCLFFFMFKKKCDKRFMNGIVFMLIIILLFLIRFVEEDGRNFIYGVYWLKMFNKVS